MDNGNVFSHQQLKQILEFLPDPAFVITRSGKYVAAWGGRDSRYYRDSSSLVGRYASDLLDKEQVDWFMEQIAASLATDCMHIVEYPVPNNDFEDLGRLEGDLVWFETRSHRLPFQVDGEDAILAVASNVTKRHKAEEELLHLSRTDSLSGLSNRRHFEHLAAGILSSAAERAQPVSVLLCDIDHFKKINDGLGHGVGDKVIVDVASLIRRQVREADIVSRWGGEEFLVLTPGARAEQAILIAERTRQAICEHHFGNGIRATISIGVASAPPLDHGLKELVDHADKALYRAKREGRNRVVSVPEGNQLYEHRLIAR